jgi:hypothetical protein
MPLLRHEAQGGQAQGANVGVSQRPQTVESTSGHCGMFGATDCELNYRHAGLMYYTYKLEHVFFSEIGVYMTLVMGNYDRLVV